VGGVLIFNEKSNSVENVEKTPQKIVCKVLNCEIFLKKLRIISVD